MLIVYSKFVSVQMFVCIYLYSKKAFICRNVQYVFLLSMAVLNMFVLYVFTCFFCLDL